jgi:hypothetical protein
MYRKAIADRVGIYDENMFCAEDYDYWIRIVLIGKIDYMNDTILYQYREHSNSLTATKKKQVSERTRDIQEKYANDFVEKFDMKYFEQAKLFFLTKSKKRNLIKYYPAFILLQIWKVGVNILALLISNKNIRHAFRRWARVQLSNKD